MRRKYRIKKHYYFLFPLFLIFIVLFMLLLDNRFLPQLKEISHMQCKTTANDIIDKSVFMNLEKLQPSTLLLKHEDTYQINAVQINMFCATLSRNITEELHDLSKETILIPVGTITGLSLFSNLGLMIPFTLSPMGAAKVDYETSFSAAGINHINYKIWLHVSIEMKVVNPLYEETIRMERKIMLADLIFNGKVPDHYFRMSSTDEYLLTE